MKRIVGISASARLWGNCETSVKSILVSAMESGAETDFVRLPDLRIEACKGCFACLSKDGVCTTDDDLHGLLESLRSADALVLAAPVYFGLPPAVLVSILDRLLTVGSYADSLRVDRPAVTVTVAGNRKWRGLAGPVVNEVAGLLGFSLLECLSIVAEGPGEVLSDSKAVEALERAGKALATDDSTVADAGKAGVCPTCKSDFFRIEEGYIVCPVCGDRGEIAAYLKKGSFVSAGGEKTWGVLWLSRHIESWIRPSIMRYKLKRKQVLKNLQSLKSLYALYQERGEKDVQ